MSGLALEIGGQILDLLVLLLKGLGLSHDSGLLGHEVLVEAHDVLLLLSHLVLGVNNLRKSFNLLLLLLHELVVKSSDLLLRSLHGLGKLLIKRGNDLLLLLEFLLEENSLVSDLSSLLFLHLVHILVLLQVHKSLLDEGVGLELLLGLLLSHLVNFLLKGLLLLLGLKKLVLEAFLKVLGVLLSGLNLILEDLDVLLELGGLEFVLSQFGPGLLLLLGRDVDFLHLVGQILLDLDQVRLVFGSLVIGLSEVLLVNLKLLSELLLVLRELLLS